VRRHVLEILARARGEIDQAVHELEEEGVHAVTDEDELADLREVRARLDALESRVAVIEQGAQ
jgi:polyhydroxyalkanoate synthesis regulator phasin